MSIKGKIGKLTYELNDNKDLYVWGEGLETNPSEPPILYQPFNLTNNEKWADKNEVESWLLTIQDL